MSNLKSILTVKATPSLIMLFIAIITFYTLEREFLSPDNIKVILAVAPELGIMVLGVAILMITGEFDLSVGSVFGLAPIVYDKLISLKWDIWLALVAVLLICAAIGAANCLITLRLGIPSFITTLGTMMIWRGAILLITQGFPPPFPKEAIPVKNVLAGQVGPIYLSLIWFVVILLILWIALERTRFGNWTFATGGNVGAARSMGINPNRVKLVNFMLVSFLAGLSGLIQAHRLGAILPSAGEGKELEAIAASVIGGTSLSGGVGGVVGSAIGALLIPIIDNGLVMARVSGYWFRAFIGTVLITAVVLNQFVRRKTRLMS
ncbi:MAG: ABC transporter permease [Anaerolineae bacterium]